MKFKQLTSLTTAMTLALGITACGGGGGSGNSTASSVGTSSVGVITGFGSVFVNGVEYETSGSNIQRDGVSASESDLAVGMVVKVRGSDDGVNGVALSIEANDEMEGIVLANNIAPGATTGTLDIMGQTVTVNADTIFESEVAGINSIDQVAVNSIVEVSGFGDGNGNVTATRIEVKAADLAGYLIEHANGIEVKGLIGTLDTGAMTFILGNMVVDYSGATLDISGSLADGLYVEVKSVAGIDSNGNLVASKVELENEGDAGHSGEQDEAFEIRGLIATGFDGTAFILDGTRIIVDSGTELKDMGTSDLTTGTEVEVEGRFDANGDLLADEVSMEAEADSEISGTIASTSSTGVNTGSITLVDGTVIFINNDTVMHDSRDNGMTPVDHFNLSFLGTGDFIEVRVYTDTNGDLVAVKLERDDNT
ncbi:MAG: hypothetical protein BMS9Abin06_1206 [Gammaproteobacteria bacterium]|nr:MAG: hypothetical protein BMS9Abin06_1206 [Gammaproteobacteria bacterium]